MKAEEKRQAKIAANAARVLGQVGKHSLEECAKSFGEMGDRVRNFGHLLTLLAAEGETTAQIYERFAPEIPPLDKESNVGKHITIVCAIDFAVRTRQMSIEQQKNN